MPKMHDDVIRAVIGQEQGKASKFDIMGDQAGVNLYVLLFFLGGGGGLFNGRRQTNSGPMKPRHAKQIRNTLSLFCTVPCLCNYVVACPSFWEFVLLCLVCLRYRYLQIPTGMLEMFPTELVVGNDVYNCTMVYMQKVPKRCPLLTSAYPNSGCGCACSRMCSCFFATM